MGRKSKKWFRMTYAKPRRWLLKHQWGIIKAGRAGGFLAGFTGGAIGAMITRQPVTMMPLWAGGTLGGTIGGEILARKVVKSLKQRLPKKTAYKVPRVRLPTTFQVVTAPVAIPFKIGEAYGESLVRRRRAKKPTLAPRRKSNPFISKKNIFVR